MVGKVKEGRLSEGGSGGEGKASKWREGKAEGP